jgi:hypothetical protein
LAGSPAALQNQAQSIVTWRSEIIAFGTLSEAHGDALAYCSL